VNDGNVVADSSALLAALKNEPFSNVDPRELVGATISAVNLCEVLAKLLEDGLSEAQADAAVSAMDLRVVSFDETGAHGSPTSLCDATCRIVAWRPRLFGSRRKLRCPVVTADHVWASLGLGLEVVLIR
jgi:PIN domain nuclease of toxin-antitoxin system